MLTSKNKISLSDRIIVYKPKAHMANASTPSDECQGRRTPINVSFSSSFTFAAIIMIAFSALTLAFSACGDNSKEEKTCEPSCEGRCCGEDGCGDECPFNCSDSESCDLETCTCEPICEPASCVQLEKECGSWDDGCGGEVDCGECPNEREECSLEGLCISHEPLELTLLQANVGNVSLDCYGGYMSNLCSVPVEERLAANIQSLQPDIVVLQELVSPEQCDDIDENNPDRVCHEAHLAEEPLQARRLVGPGYTIVCDERNGFECVAVAASFGSIEGCGQNEVCLNSAETLEVPQDCDPGFTVSAVTVAPTEESVQTFKVINGHPASGLEVDCRADQIRRIFESVGDNQALAPEAIPSMVAGDFNLDPYRQNDESVNIWKDHVGQDKTFSYHSGIAEHDPPYYTSFSAIGNYTLDHVVSNTAQGTCLTLGEAPDTDRLDGGAGCDHRALWCALMVNPYNQLP